MKQYKAAIIGCGNIFPMHAASIVECKSSTLVAVCDIKPDRAKLQAQNYGCNWYTDYEEMLEKEEIDVVHICLPHYLHPPVAIYCMKKGKHIMTEKPMSIAIEDAEEMIATAKECGVLLACIFQNRYNAGAIMVKNELDNGNLGKVKSAKCSVTWDRSDAYYGSSDWKGTWDKEGGGVIIDQAIHTLDLMRYLINDEVDYVDATIANRGHAKIDVEDTAEGAIMFKNGILANFHAINYYTYDADVEIEMHCEKGIVKIAADRAEIRYNTGKTLIAVNDPSEVINYGDVKSYWGVNHIKQIKNYYEALETGTTPFIPVENAFKTQQMVCAIYKSGKEKRKIYISELSNNK